jgi:hypothetical protein
VGLDRGFPPRQEFDVQHSSAGPHTEGIAQDGERGEEGDDLPIAVDVGAGVGGVQIVAKGLVGAARQCGQSCPSSLHLGPAIGVDRAEMEGPLDEEFDKELQRVRCVVGLILLKLFQELCDAPLQRGDVRRLPERLELRLKLVQLIELKLVDRAKRVGTELRRKRLEPRGGFDDGMELFGRQIWVTELAKPRQHWPRDRLGRARGRENLYLRLGLLDQLEEGVEPVLRVAVQVIGPGSGARGGPRRAW